MRRSRSVAVASACSVALIGVVATAGPTGAASPLTRISGSTSIGDTAQQPSIAKFGNTYEAVWVQVSGTSYSLKARILNAAGAPVGGIVSVLSNWALIRDFPTILTANGQRIIAFNGYKNQGGNAAYDSPAEYYLTSTNGTTWALAAGSLSPKVPPNGADGTVAAFGASSVISALATGQDVSYLQGFSPDNPATGWTGHTSATGNGTAYPGVATAAGTKAWIASLSQSSAASQIGVNVQPVLPSLGTRKQAPQSFTGGAASPVHQGVPLVVRTGTTGPPYTAYVRQDGARVFVWRYGASAPISLATGGGAGFVTLTSAPGGRLWLLWSDNKGWRATRSNKAATRFGPITTVHIPTNALHASLSAAGVGGPLEAVLLVDPGYDAAKTGIYAVQIHPRLSCSASPKSGKPGTKIAIRVLDVNDAVSGATVHFAGKTGRTNSRGVVTFTIPRGPTGKRTVTTSHSGYTGCATSVTVT